MIERTLKQSQLDNYINGNYSDLDEITKILAASYTSTLVIGIEDDTEE